MLENKKEQKKKETKFLKKSPRGRERDPFSGWQEQGHSSCPNRRWGTDERQTRED